MSDLSDGLTLFAEGSSTMVTWALALGAGSVAAIVSTSYLRPKQRWARLFYLLFPVGWAFLGISVYHGNEIARRGIAGGLVKSEELHAEIISAMNSAFKEQLDYLALGLIAFAIWLLLYLGWWIYVDKVTEEKA